MEGEMEGGRKGVQTLLCTMYYRGNEHKGHKVDNRGMICGGWERIVSRKPLVGVKEVMGEDYE